MEQLRAFDASNSAEGLFFRYARGRVNAFVARQVVTICGSVVLAVTLGPKFGLTAFLIAVVFELIDTAFLQSLIKRGPRAFHSKTAYNISIVTGTAHLIALCVCLSIGWLAGGEDFRFFVLTFFAGASLNVGISFRYHKHLSIVKFAALLSVTIGLFLYDFAIYGTQSYPLILDAFAAALMAYTIAAFCQFFHAKQIREMNVRREFLNAVVRLESNATDMANKDREIQRMAAVAQHSNDAIAIRDGQESLVWVNKKFCETYGYSSDEVIGKKISDVIKSPESEMQTIGRISENIVYKSSFRYQIKNFDRDGCVIWLDETLVPLPVDSDGNESFLSIARDITELKNREIEFARLAALARYSNDSICFVDPDGKILWVNAAFETVIGHSTNDAVGQDALMLFTGPKTDKNVINSARENYETIQPMRFNFQCCHKDGTDLWLDTSVTPILDEKQCLQNWIFVARDVTEAHRQSHELKTAKVAAESATQAKSNFLATMSHEIRTPMNGIIGMSDLLLNSKLTKEQLEYVETIVGSGEALLQIINDILDFSKLDAGKLNISEHPFDLRKTLKSSLTILEPIASEKGVDLVCKIHPDLPNVCIGDDGRIRQIIINLVGNAIKFTDNGHVQIDCHCTPSANKNHVKITVADTGIGIPNEALERIFDTFSQADGETTRKFGGTGLGLSISKLLSTQMGGDIVVSSELGQGSTFTLTMELPTAPDSAIEQRTAQISRHDTDLPENFNILVAEDNKTNQLLLRKMLTPTGAKLRFVPDGEAAVNAFIAAAPNLVLMDVSMPIKNGIEATQDIRTYEAMNARDETPIIALTANAYAEDEKRCLNAGMNAFLTKPIKKNVLLQTINSLVSPKDVSTSTSVENLRAAQF